MATNQIKARHILAAKTLTEWNDTTTIPLKGETCYEIIQETDKNDFIIKMKVGNGVDLYKDLPYVGTQVISGDNWIVTTTSDGVTQITHADPQAENSSKSRAVSGAQVVTGVSVDAKGHVRTSPSIKTMTEGAKIDITNDSSKITIKHESTTRNNTNGSKLAFDGSVITGVTTDATGHVTGVETSTLPANPVSAASSTSGKLMVSDGDNTTSASSYTASNGTFSASSTTTLYTGKSIADYIGNTISPLSFKGTIGTGGTVTALPNNHTKGDTYVVKTAGTYAGQACEVGDMIICVTTGTAANNADWNVLTGENQITNKAAQITSTSTTIATIDGVDITARIPDYATIAPVQSVAGTDPISVTTSSNKATVSHTDSGVTAGTYGPTANVSGSNNATIKVPQIEVDAKGHVKSIVERTYTSVDHTYTVNNGTLQVVANSATTGISTPFTANGSTAIGLNFIDGNATKAVVTAVTDKAPTIKFNHADTSSQSNITNTDNTWVNSVTLDTYGHVTGLTQKGLVAGYGDSVNPYGSKNKNLVLASPASGAGAPTFRALTAADLTFGISLTSTGATSTSSNNAKLVATKATSDVGIARTTTGLHTSLLMDDANVTLIIDGNF